MRLSLSKKSLPLGSREVLIYAVVIDSPYINLTVSSKASCRASVHQPA